MARCIQLDLECPAICYAAAQVMSLHGESAPQLCNVCADICNACGDECAKHELMQYCKECADACHQCGQECRQMASMAA